MSGFLWKTTVSKVNRELKKNNTFEWKGDCWFWRLYGGGFGQLILSKENFLKSEEGQNR